MGSLSEFQKRKILAVFNTLYDTNKDGVIEKCDFEEAAQKVCNLHHWKQGGDKYKSAEATLSSIWGGLRKFADKNEDDRVTKDEWITMWDDCVKNLAAGKGFPDWQKNYMEFMFLANDTSGDGFIDKEEYITIYELFGISAESAGAAFDKLAQGTDGKISWNEFESLWTEYFTSDNPSVRGNFLFGQIPV
ncbi:sarcoplasmic calcium-binding proteins I, III, and IV [Patella vulgata]|uniref:sarcoplasmic calcium-binding proteins I, III, and IV n=1 Tax=Patella vulgata TaxID=6465 RepID=UPI0024A8F4F4|nr:sarcoplasmic calcium-binding proteins I, III, and IV [Patella vulgata]